MPIQIDIPVKEIEQFCKKNGIKKLSFFGSVLNYSFTEESDIDVLVEFEQDVQVGLLSLSGMEQELEGIIGRRIDLNTEGLLSPYFREDVLAGALSAYES